MPAVTRISALAAAALTTAAAALVPAAPAGAHGATTAPLSRTAACGGQGTQTRSAACRAARAANGGPIGAFDNLRIPDVNGRDREVVPDGELCSGGLSGYAGLDLPRDDWPVTDARAGQTLALRYATTIPHRGTFRVYLTRQGYDPGRRLRWADLGTEPLLVDKDPPLRDGAYRMSVRLPEKRTGRHVLYVIWQTSSTPDTYYTCSDLDLSAPKAVASAPASRAATPPAATRKAAAAPRLAPRRSAAPSPVATTTAPAVTPVAAVDRGGDLPRYALPGALLLLAVFGVPLLFLLSRRRHRDIR